MVTRRASLASCCFLLWLGCVSTSPMMALLEGDIKDVVPPAVTVYQKRDENVVKRWAGGKPPPPSTGGRQELLNDLIWTQWHDPTCHSAAHSIGRKIFHALDHNITAALELCEYRCTGGCVHGALGAYAGHALEDLPDADVAETFREICTEKGTLTEMMGVGECGHAVGHALTLAMGTDRALRFCDAHLPGVYPEGARHSIGHYCAGGVVMEAGSAFFYKAGETRKPKHSSTIVGHCADPLRVPAMTAAACFYYGLRGREETPATLLAECLQLKDRQPACVFGAATHALFGHGKDSRIPSAVALCKSLPRGDLRNACIDGIVFRNAKYGSDDVLKKTCQGFDNHEDAVFCTALGEAGMYTMRKDRLILTYQQ